MKYKILVLCVVSILKADTMMIDASDWDIETWTFLNLNLGSIVYPESPKDDLGWDLAFQRYHIRTNSGLAGIGNGGAYHNDKEPWTLAIYNDLTEVSESSYFIRDTILNTFYDIESHSYVSGVANPKLETSLEVGDNFQMLPSNNQFIVRTALGDEFYKLWVSSYYNGNGQSGFITITYDIIEPCHLGHDSCGECGGDNLSCTGCMDESAINYDQMAYINDDDLCEYLLYGDVNSDNTIDILDIVIVLSGIIDGQYNDLADLNDDSQMNILDVILMVNIIIES